MEKAVKLSDPMTHERSTLLLQETNPAVLSPMPPHQGKLSFNLGLSGKLKQRAMKQARKLVYLEGCALHIWT